jgi:F-type H+-transporting ATPase subunit gamma
MANLRDIQKRRKSAASTKKITRTMELVASSKLQKAQNAAAASRPYAEGMRELVIGLASGQPKGAVLHPLMAKRAAKRVTIVLCTSDRGLCGSFNAVLVDKALKRAAHWRKQGAEVEFVSIGKKGATTLAFFGSKPKASHVKIAGSPTFIQAEKIAKELMADFLAKGSDVVEVIYQRFISSVRAVPDLYVMLPAGQDVEQAAPKGPRPGFIYEPEPEDIFTFLVPQSVTTGLFSALVQTAAAEHAARRMAMKNATDAAGDMVKDLARRYNRGRQGKITQEIAEIVGAVEAMA